MRDVYGAGHEKLRKDLRAVRTTCTKVLRQGACSMCLKKQQHKNQKTAEGPVCLECWGCGVSCQKLRSEE